MSRTGLVILQQDYERFVALLDQLCTSANARFVFLLDKNGQHIASVGDLAEVDPTALASLAAGSVAATEGLAGLVGEQVFTTLFHEGQTDSLHLSTVAEKAIVLVSFDARSSLGLVRLRVQQSTSALAAAFTEVVRRSDAPRAEALSMTPLGDLTDAEIDRLFG
jgi:predicted regulator of Ras-like GTPase activity (Roadblock/LC7/MglB family)